MNINEVVTQVKALCNSEITQDLAEQSFGRLLCIEQALGLPSDRKAKVSDRLEAVLVAVAALEELHATPIKAGAPLVDLRLYHKQQAEVIEKLEALQHACSDSAAGSAVTSLKLLKKLQGATNEALKEWAQKTNEVVSEWVQEADKRLGAIPIAQIVASDPKLSSEIGIIEIAREGTPISLLRLKSYPAIAFPIWAISSDQGGTAGRILIRIAGLDAPEDASSVEKEGPTDIVKTFGSVCACCSDRIWGNSPFVASLPADRTKEAVEKWLASPDGVADWEWRYARGREFVGALKEACDTYGITTIASRKAHLWVEEFPGELEGMVVVDAGDPDVIYFKHLGEENQVGFSEGGVFRLER